MSIVIATQILIWTLTSFLVVLFVAGIIFVIKETIKYLKRK